MEQVCSIEKNPGQIAAATAGCFEHLGRKSAITKKQEMLIDDENVTIVANLSSCFEVAIFSFILPKI